MTTGFYMRNVYIFLDNLLGLTTREPSNRIVTTEIVGKKWVVKFPDYKDPLIITIEDDELDFTGPNDIIILLNKYIDSHV